MMNLLRTHTLPIIAVSLIAFAAMVYAITPANTLIVNQASASYKDSLGVDQILSSNSVRTVIKQVAAIDLQSNQNKNAIAGSTILIPHLVVNQGNDDDIYNLTVVDAAGDDFNFGAANIRIFADADSNGEPDNNIVISETPDLFPNQSYSFVIQVTVPSGALAATNGQLTVTATSQINGSINDVNTDTVSVIDDAVIRVTKTISAVSGIAGSGPYKVNLNYENIGSKSATSVTLVDVLPAGMTYVGNARWSLGNLALTDANEEVQAATPSIVYCAYDASCTNANQVRIVVDEVGVGQSGSIEFEVSIGAATPPSTLYNTADYGYTQEDNTVITGRKSNTVPFLITGVFAVAMTGDSKVNIEPGTTVFLNNIVTNNGNVEDSFNVVVDAATSTFPAGAGFFLYRADGVTPLADTNGDGISDTGPLAAGQSFTVVLAVIVTSTSPAGVYTVNKVASSLTDSSVQATATDSVTVIALNPAVDLTNNFPRGNPSCAQVSDNCGFDAYDAAQPPITTVTVDPGNEASFSLFVVNRSIVPQSYDLYAAASDTLNANNSLQGGGFPAGWQVRFEDTSGNIINNTGNLVPLGTFEYVAKVFVPANALVQTAFDVFFQVHSPSSNVQDIKRDAITVTAFDALQFTPNNIGATARNTFTVYKHEIENRGNVSQTIDSFTAVNDRTGGWSSTIYEDTAGGDAGIFDTNDNLLTAPFTLAPGERKVVYNRVFVPSSAAPSELNVTTITITYNGGASSLFVTDGTTANPFDVDIVKEQAIDVDCNAVADNAFVPTTFSAQPGNCIVYRITVNNASVITANNVVITDATPVYTLYHGIQPSPRCLPTDCAGAITVEPSSGSTGIVSVAVGNMVPGDKVEFFFVVRVSDS